MHVRLIAKINYSRNVLFVEHQSLRRCESIYLRVAKTKKQQSFKTTRRTSCVSLISLIQPWKKERKIQMWKRNDPRHRSEGGKFWNLNLKKILLFFFFLLDDFRPYPQRDLSQHNFSTQILFLTWRPWNYWILCVCE